MKQPLSTNLNKLMKIFTVKAQEVMMTNPYNTSFQ